MVQLLALQVMHYLAIGKMSSFLIAERFCKRTVQKILSRWIRWLYCLWSRKDMAKLEQRTATLSEVEPCASCGRAVGASPPSEAPATALPPYFLFPTGNAFHGTCLTREVLALATASQRQRLHNLLPSSDMVREHCTLFVLSITFKDTKSVFVSLSS